MSRVMGLLQQFREFRLQVGVKIAGSAGTKLYARVDYYNPGTASMISTTLANVAAAGELLVSSTGMKDTGWFAAAAGLATHLPLNPGDFGVGDGVTVPDDSNKGATVQLFGSGGNGTINPEFGMILLQGR
jgi:hypothetical protein